MKIQNQQEGWRNVCIFYTDFPQNICDHLPVILEKKKKKAMICFAGQYFYILFFEIIWPLKNFFSPPSVENQTH